MDYQKVDASLALALSDVQDQDARAFQVFIHVARPPGPKELALLEDLGVTGITSGRSVYTATLSANQVTQLSHMPWVRALKLSQKLRLLKPDA
ncbi:MAG: hypothetical protein FJ147_21940 [Deltaproteobacteria bacterium]|nr:hypothetical protein [Deltaproteobacteria bacterium]